MKKYIVFAAALLLLLTAGCSHRDAQPSTESATESVTCGASDKNQTEALFSGQGIPLSEKELDWFADYTLSVRERYDEEQNKHLMEVAPFSCFFTCQYSDPRDLSATDFLRYCPEPAGQEPVNEEEFTQIQEVQNWRGDNGHLLTLTELPVPCHRLPRTYLNEILMQYAGITVEEMTTNWMEETLYVPATDCFYTFTSDFAPGSFQPCYGEKDGGLVTLWDGSHVLTLQKAGDSFHILSYQAASVSN